MGTAGLPTMHGPKWLPFDDDELNEGRMSQFSKLQRMVHAKASNLQVPSRPFYSALSATQKPKRLKGVFVTTGVDSSSFFFCVCTNVMNWQPRSKYVKSKNASHIIDWQIKLSN
jgi:hypothetical protein